MSEPIPVTEVAWVWLIEHFPGWTFDGADLASLVAMIRAQREEAAREAATDQVTEAAWTEADLGTARVFRRRLQDNYGALRSAAPSDEDLATLIRAQREDAAKEALTLLHPTTGLTIDGQAWVEQIRADAILPISAERDAAREEVARLVGARELVLTERDAAWADLSAAREKVRRLRAALVGMIEEHDRQRTAQKIIPLGYLCAPRAKAITVFEATGDAQ